MGNQTVFENIRFSRLTRKLKYTKNCKSDLTINNRIKKSFVYNFIIEKIILFFGYINIFLKIKVIIEIQIQQYSENNYFIHFEFTVVIDDINKHIILVFIHHVLKINALTKRNKVFKVFFTLNLFKILLYYFIFSHVLINNYIKKYLYCRTLCFVLFDFRNIFQNLLIKLKFFCFVINYLFFYWVSRILKQFYFNIIYKNLHLNFFDFDNLMKLFTKTETNINYISFRTIKKTSEYLFQINIKLVNKTSITKKSKKIIVINGPYNLHHLSITEFKLPLYFFIAHTITNKKNTRFDSDESKICTENEIFFILK